MVRPIMENAATVSDPHTNKNIQQLEMIQRRAARWTLDRYYNTSSVTAILNILPGQHSKFADPKRISGLYNMVHGLVAIDIGFHAIPVIRQTQHTHIRVPSYK